MGVFRPYSLQVRLQGGRLTCVTYGRQKAAKAQSEATLNKWRLALAGREQRARHIGVASEGGVHERGRARSRLLVDIGAKVEE